MAALFLSLYDFFHTRKTVFWSVFLTAVLVLGYLASRIQLEEDITKFFPDDQRVEKLNYVFQHSKFVERLVVMVSVKDSTTQPAPDSLVSVASELVTKIEKDFKPYVKKVNSQVEDEKILDVFKTIYDYLPAFLDDHDYAELDSLTQPSNVKRVLEENYRQLISPSGIAVKKIIVQDPLGFSFLAIRKLQHLQYDENFELYDGYIMTKDHRHLIFFIQPVYGPGATGKNAPFIEQLNALMQEESSRHPILLTSFFGAPAVAVGNAEQLRADTILTVSIMIVLLGIFLIGFFRKKRVPLLIIIPAAFGGVFSMACIYLVQGSVSILAIAAGSVILGIAVNYSLHFLAHLTHTHNVKDVIRDLVAPMTLGSTTTVLAFFCLQFANAAVLRDVGLFAAFSLIGAALCSLIFLPHFIPEKLFSMQHQGFIERIPFGKLGSSRIVVWTILLATPVFFYFARQVSFNSDMSRLNFMKAETAEAQRRLETINRSSLSSVYVVSSGKNLNEALKKTEQVTPVLQRLKNENAIYKYATLSSFLISDSLQEVRLKKWNDFWSPERVVTLNAVVQREGHALKFSDQVLTNFNTLITRPYQLMDSAASRVMRTAFFDDYIIEKDTLATAITLVNVDPAKKAALYTTLEKTPVHAFDRQMLTNLFVEYVNADFNFIVTFTAILVFSALFISYGRIELTLITFTPMFITWIWILGIMALLGIEFNIVNVMVSTFIFGLGDDYSIFIMDGLQEEYKTGKKNLPSIRISIFLSAVTTIAGLGVLILAKHPALRSIASISIIGIVCVFIMSQTIEPYLFRGLITNRVRKGFTPMTWAGFIRTFVTYFLFVAGALVLTVIGILFKLIPFGKKSLRLTYHRMLSGLMWLVLYIDPKVRKNIIDRTDKTFSRASIIIANHASFLDILATTMLHPKLILLTNKWVWNSPVFGGVVRLADYYPVTEGAEDSIDKLKERVEEGYSVVVFPEGKRSEDGQIKRFHKGAFFMAESLGVPIQPLLIHGAAFGIPKGSFYLNDSHLGMKFLPPIEPGDKSFGDNYSERTKRVSRYFKDEHARLARELETPYYYRYWLIANYLYKGPVLEWYLRVKIRLENDYAVFDKLVASSGNILDLGCGYGFLCYMLQFLSDQRTITGVDYDEDKIATAQHGYLRTDRLNFFYDDVTRFPLEQYNSIIISDVLHYLTPDDQDALIERCLAALNPGGNLIIRDGNADLKERHKGTKLTEFFSIRLLKFNKSVNTLSFVSGKRLHALALRNGYDIKVMDDAKYTSNVIFVFTKKLNNP